MGSDVNLSTIIYENIKKDIIEMRREPDTYLLERQVAAEHNTSRTPVREAIKRLMQEGWLVGEDRCRTKISDLNLAACHDVFAVRMMIEHYALTETFSRGEGRALAGKLDVEMKKMASLEDDPIDFVRADVGFHSVIVEHIGNALLTKIWRSISDEIIRISIFAMDEQRQPEKIVLEHAKIVDALWNHAPDLLTTLDNHMNHILEGMERCFERRDGGKEAGGSR